MDEAPVSTFRVPVAQLKGFLFTGRHPCEYESVDIEKNPNAWFPLIQVPFEVRITS